ncbi:MAG: IS66 family transposase [Chloroflexota bacterium]|nr:IS66 family transposase [Chloroflexota bacterium]
MARRAAHPASEQLLSLVGELRDRIAALEAENARLRAALAALRGTDAPPPAGATTAPQTSVPATARRRPPPGVKANVVILARRCRRTPRSPVPGRRRDVPDRVVVHAPTVCPHCGDVLRRGRLVGRRQIIELPPVRAEVAEHQVRERRCRGCGWAGRGALPDLTDHAGPHRRVGWGVAALVATLRTKLRLPLAQVQWLLERTWGLRLSVGEVSGLLTEVARVGRGAYDALLAEARASPVVHMDETGWRENGRNGYIWTVSTPTVRVFSYAQGRAGAVADRLLGEGGTGTVVSDFYGAYDRLTRPQQRCWAHLLRDVRALCDDHPADHRLQRWAVAVGKVHAKAVAWTEQATADGVRPILRERVADRFAQALVAICRQPAGSPQAVLCQRIERYQTELFTFVADPAVPPTNNAAERALRPLVIARKISGGTRSKQGSQTRMILQSLVATWDLRGLDPVAEFLALLRDGAQPSQELAPV